MGEQVGPSLLQYGAVGVLALVCVVACIRLYRDSRIAARASEASSERFIQYLEKQAAAAESRDLVLRAVLDTQRAQAAEQEKRHIEHAGRLTGLTREVQLSTKAAESAAQSAAAAASSAANPVDFM